MPNIYAAGDCTTFVPLASVASMQGRTAVFHALGDVVIPLEHRRITSNIFTAPEIATIGWSEQDIADGLIDGVVHKLPLAANPRAKMMGIKDGFVKLLARQGSGTVIGGVIVAPRASELIYPIAIAVERRLTVDQLSRVFAVYPSLTGSITDAARAMHIVDRANGDGLSRSRPADARESPSGRVGRRDGGRRDRQELVTGGDRRAGGRVDRTDHAVLVRLDRLLHLHRLEHDHEVALDDLLTVLDGDLDDRRLHRRLHGIAGCPGDDGRRVRPPRRRNGRGAPASAGRGDDPIGQADLEPLAGDLDDHGVPRLDGLGSARAHRPTAGCR